MLDFDMAKHCTGCCACYNICPVNAIKMSENNEGFWEPEIDKEKCILCGKCKQVCPYLNSGKKGEKVRGTWLFHHEDDAVKMRSSSGGACYELSNAMLGVGGYFSGCIWNYDLEAVHIVSDENCVLEKTQGSKYVQSYMGDIYENIMELLRKGKKVIFTGTPCQATALHNYVTLTKDGIYRKNLINVAFICHGVASPYVWEQYKKWEKEKHGSPLKKVNFRDKSKEGYKKSYCRYEYENGMVTYLPTFLPQNI